MLVKMTTKMDRLRGLSRRTLFRNGGILAALGLLPHGRAAAEPSATGLKIGPALYESIGVKPIVNCRGTFTIITGSQSLPEVKRAMDEASRHYVHLDELMDAVGKRLAELTKADWGIVTAGCAAAITHATAACIAGSDPEKMQQLPDLTGLKNEVIMPRYSRNVYDHAARMLGVKIVEVETPEQLEHAINPKTALVLILASPPSEQGPLSTEVVTAITRPRNVPVLVDAAAEFLTIPNIHLQHGATMVAYSGGKCIRGPQAAGLLLGPKDLLQAAWLNSAPHHAFGRSLKVGKEEIMGMLAAVEMWTHRDHKAEWAEWESWLNHIDARVKSISGVTSEVRQPVDLSNHAPTLRIQWDPNALGITGKQLERELLNGAPRITVAGSTANSLTVMPYMMMPGDHKIAADAIHALLSKPPKFNAPEKASAPSANITGQWKVNVEFTRGQSEHVLILEQHEAALVGSHLSPALKGDLQGSLSGNEVRFHSSHRFQGTSINYDFTGTVAGDTITGTVTMGEYGQAAWTATRHHYA
jgi:D-glucosaminate-6-phosphate ammonia-lyase